MISGDDYPFVAFPDLTCHFQGKEWVYLLVTLCQLISRRPNLEVATKRLLHQQIKIPGRF